MTQTEKRIIINTLLFQHSGYLHTHEAVRIPATSFKTLQPLHFGFCSQIVSFLDNLSACTHSSPGDTGGLKAEDVCNWKALCYVCCRNNGGRMKSNSSLHSYPALVSESSFLKSLYHSNHLKPILFEALNQWTVPNLIQNAKKKTQLTGIPVCQLPIQQKKYTVKAVVRISCQIETFINWYNHTSLDIVKTGDHNGDQKARKH